MVSCSADEIILNPTDQFTIAKGNSIEQVTTKALVQAPVVMTQDAKGRLWVVEMPGYMRDIDGNGEDIADGRIVIIEDKDGDGIFDDRTVILNNLLNPRAILLAYGGILYTDGNALVFCNLEDDVISDKIVVDSLYINGGNIEHKPNGLYYNIDNWIYSAKSKVRYKYDNGKWKKEATSSRGQWGMSSDETGRLVYNHNSAPILGDVHMPNTLLSNPYLKINHNIGNLYTDDMSVYPLQATSVNRGYDKGVLDDDGKLISYTSACAPHVYYGAGLEADYQSNIFVCAPEINAISRFSVDHKYQTAQKVDTTLEFLVSSDETFRPVNLLTGYDDCLYVVDLRKGIIQHSAYMSSYLREKIVENDFDKITGLGNIYRITKENYKLSKVDLNSIKDEQLVDLFSSSNLATRIYAQRQIIHKEPNGIVSKLKTIVSSSKNNIQQLHALWTLDGIGKLDPILLSELDPDNIDPRIWTAILPLIDKYSEQVNFSKLFNQLAMKNDSTIDIQLAPYLGSSEDLWKGLASHYPKNSQMAEALLGGIESNNAPQLNLRKLPELAKILKNVDQNIKSESKQVPTLEVFKDNDTRTNGLQIFKQNCASCHGMDGRGQKLLAPDLTDSKFLQGPESGLVEVIFKGYDSGKEEYQIKMPAYIENAKMTDQDVSDLVNYLISTFAKRWGGIKPEDVSKVRTQLKKK